MADMDVIASVGFFGDFSPTVVNPQAYVYYWNNDMVLFLSQLQSITSDRQLKVVTNPIINFSLCDRSACL